MAREWKIRYVNGDLVEDAEQFDVICHGCNCQIQMGAGIAKSVKRKFPGAYKADLATRKGDKKKLGTLSTFDSGEVIIANAYTQFNYGIGRGGGIPLSYSALRKCMQELKRQFSGKSIGLPLIGSGLARGNEDLIKEIIEEELEGEDVTIVIFKPGVKIDLKTIKENENR